jgi:hypothetical protein
MTEKKYTPAELRKKGITARKYMGDDRYSWAVFVHNRPVVTGLGRSEVDYHRQIIARLSDKR